VTGTRSLSCSWGFGLKGIRSRMCLWLGLWFGLCLVVVRVRVAVAVVVEV
jgi:hypothetical protein